MKKKILALATAIKMADAIEKKAKELNLKVIIAILDDGGNLKYFRRMDGTSYGSVRVSQIKATTAASWPISSRGLGERNMKMANSPYGGGSIPGIVLLPGGLPIVTADGEHLGGVGVSGATSDQDEVCAQAGLDAIREDLS